MLTFPALLLGFSTPNHPPSFNSPGTSSTALHLSKHEPNIQVYNVDAIDDRSITLHHTQHNLVPLHAEQASEAVKHPHNLWQFDAHLHSLQDDEISSSIECTDKDVKIISSPDLEERTPIEGAP